MGIELDDILGFNFFQYGSPYIGECGGMHFRLARNPLENVVFNHDPHKNDEALFDVTIWRGPYNYDKTRQKKTTAQFPFTEDGRIAAVQIYVAEKIGVYRYSAKNTELPEREFLSRCKVLDIIANPKGMYVYNNYDDYDNEIMDAFDTVYTNVKKAVKNADEIENTVDALYSGWFHINAFFCLGILDILRE